MRPGLLHSSRAGLFMLAGVVGCSNSAPPKGPDTAAAAADGTSSAEGEDLPALTPVSAPENLVGIATLRTPARTLDTAMAWTGLGLDFRTFVQAGPGAALLPILDLEAPLEVVVTL